MTVKKVFGYVLIVISAILALVFLGRSSALLHDIVAFLKIFTGKLDGYQVGYAIGTMFGWTILLALMILCWNVGRSWIKK